MDFRGREVDFQEADRRYEELKRQLDAGSISEEEFDEQLKNLMVQDESGRWWVKSRTSGEWHYNDGKSWVRGTPLSYSHPTSATLDQNTGEQRRREDRSIVGVIVWLAILVVVLGGAAGVADRFLASTETTSSEKASSTTEDTVAPDLRGKTVREAAQTVGTDYVLDIVALWGKTSEGGDLTDNQPKGTIVSQDPLPLPGEPAARGSVIELNLSGGQSDVVVPDVSGLSILRAATILIDAGLDPDGLEITPHRLGELKQRDIKPSDIKVRVDQNGNPVAATATYTLDGSYEEDVSDRTVTDMGQEEGTERAPGLYVTLEYAPG